jgi:hypothetical protein
MMRGQEVAVRLALLVLISTMALPLIAPLRAQEKPRAWVAPNAAWRTHGNSGAEIENRAVEVSSDFGRTCKEVIVNADFDKANYVVEINRRAAYAPIRITRTDIAVYRWNADLVGGASKSSIGAAVKAACDIMKKDWPDAPHDLRPKKEDQDRKPTSKTIAFPQ